MAATPAAPKPPTKSELAQRLATRASSADHEFSARDAQDFLNALYDEMAHSLLMNDKFELHGFAQFGLKHKPATEARVGSKPGGKPGETVTYKAKPASNTVTFKVRKGLLDRVNPM